MERTNGKPLICSSGKSSFSTHAIAKAAAKKIKACGGLKLRTYRCRECDKYHLTKSVSMPEEMRRAGRDK